MTRQTSGPKAQWQPRDWAEEQALRVAKEIRRLRGPRSAQWLADQTKEWGYEITRSVISDLENGRRRYVTIAELVIFARALNTSPVALMYPGRYDLSVEMSPGSDETQITAAQWFSGLLETRYATRDTEDAAEYDQNLKRLRTWREFRELDRDRSALLERLTESGRRIRMSKGATKLSDAEHRQIIDAMADLERRAQELTASDGW